MEWKKMVDDYFMFTRKERIGVIVLIVLILGVWLAPSYFARNRMDAPVIDTALLVEMEAAKKEYITRHEQDDRHTGTPERTPESSLFYFDPNELDSVGWRKLGVRERTITTIMRFRAKGGRFRSRVDIFKIYGLSRELANQLMPYVTIRSQEKPKITDTFVRSEYIPSKRVAYKSESIDINTADTSGWKQLPGIGSKLASRIVLFREKLGGFYSIDQVREVYGIHDTAFQKFSSYLKNDNASVKTININTATKDELKQHPYIKWSLANAIVEFRSKHGRFLSIDDLLKIHSIDLNILEKLKPYLQL